MEVRLLPDPSFTDHPQRPMTKPLTYHQLWYLKNRDRIRQQQKAYKASPEAKERERRQASARRVANPDRHRDVQKKWRASNPGAHRARHVRTKYGISIEEYTQRFEAQEGLCAVCSKPLVLWGRSKNVAHLDHDHASGILRGFLCMSCNVGIGSFGDDTDRLASAVHYLNKFSR